ncbi:cation:proton antiporter [Vulcanococcus limneticus]|uniref:cation:proton antiporter domain-containing protein n=1 Tax=Vulcanococcus limneticus TaxID=2170428 RepID=UPI00398C1EB7
MTTGLQGLLAVLAVLEVLAVVALVPFLVRAVHGRVPAVALLMLARIAVGPSGLGWPQPNPAIDLLEKIGLGLILALIGLTIDQKTLGGTAGRLGFLGWLSTLGIGTLLAALLLLGDGLRPGPSWWPSAPRPSPPSW